MNLLSKKITLVIVSILLLIICSAGKFLTSAQKENDFTNDNLAPFGANPTEKFTTNIVFNKDSSSYVFEYSGGHKIIYYLPLNDPIIQQGMIKIGAQVDEGDILYPVVAGGTRYYSQNQQLLEPQDFAKNAKVKLISQSLNNNVVTINYQETYQGITNEKTIEYSMKGKTIVVHVYGKNTEGTGNYYGFSFGASEKTLNPQGIEIPYLTEPLVLFNNQFFYSTYLDRSKSNSVNFDKIIRVLSSDSIQAYQISESSPDSQGKIAPLDETGYITVSDDIHDVIPQINNQPSLYRNTLSDKAVVDLWWINPVDFGLSKETDTYKASKLMLDSFYEYGLTNLAVIYHNWQRFGYDTKLPSHYPANPAYGTEKEFSQLIETAKSYKYLIALHENYVDSYPDSPLYNESDIARNSDLSKKTGWYNGGTGQQAFDIASNKAQTYAESEGQSIKQHYTPNAAFLDVDTGILPIKFLNFEASNPDEKSFSEAVKDMKSLFVHQKSQYNGPLFGEGSEGANRYDSYYAGYVDGVERQIEGNYSANIIPDFELLSVKPLMVNQGMGYYGRYFVAPGSDQISLNPTEDQWDLYRASEIAYGHAAFISNATIESNSSYPMGSMEQTFTEYHLLQSLQNQYLNSTPTAILYEDNGEMVPLDQALADKVDFANDRILIQYQNGLNIYLNFNRGSEDIFASQDFSFTQGSKNWYYEYWNGTKYQEMQFGTDNWKGNAEWCLLWADGAHPDLNYQPTLVWESPIAATVEITGQIYDLDPNCGNGIKAEIYQNDDLLWSAQITNGDSTGKKFNLNVPVVEKDKIYFRINANGNQDCDSTYLNPNIKYTYPTSPWEVKVNNTEYSLPADGWVAWNNNQNFLEYSTKINQQRVDYVDSQLYTFARSRSGKLQTIGKLSVDGTVMLTKSENSNFHDIHFIQTSQILDVTQNKPIVTTSEKSDLNLNHPSENQIHFIFHNAKQNLVDLQYFDLPDKWIDNSSNTPDLDSIKVWKLDASGNHVGNPIPWSLTSKNDGMLINGLMQDQWYEINYSPVMKVESPTQTSTEPKQTNHINWVFYVAGIIFIGFIVMIILLTKKKK